MGRHFSDVIDRQTASYGIPRNTPVDRTATTGIFQFKLNNASGKYTQGYPGYNVAFTKNALIWLHFTYEELDLGKFYGHISSIRINVRDKTVDVVALDWMDYASTFALTADIEYDKYVEEVVADILTLLPVQPLDVVYGSGNTLFPTVFDTIGKSLQLPVLK